MPSPFCAANQDSLRSTFHIDIPKKQTSSNGKVTTMSYYFAIIGTQDNPLFEYEFGTSKQGGDGIARFPEQARHMNQFIVHSSLDIVEEVQWAGGQMYVSSLPHTLLVPEVLLPGISSASTASTTIMSPAS
jgi:hypothetical protein